MKIYSSSIPALTLIIIFIFTFTSCHIVDFPSKVTDMPLTRYQIDTLHKGTDSVIFFVRRYIDTTLAESYKCKFDSTDITFRYGLFHLKKGIAIEYRPIDIRDRKEYPWTIVHPGLRGFGGGELRLLRRLN